MTQEQFLIALYGIATDLANALTVLLQNVGPYVGPLLEAVAFLLLAADVTLFWVKFGVCAAAP
jgi:hypothetical protein